MLSLLISLSMASFVIDQTTCPGTLKQNGESKNRHYLEITSPLLFHLHIPKVF